jgi:hypothetical protein
MTKKSGPATATFPRVPEIKAREEDKSTSDVVVADTVTQDAIPDFKSVDGDLTAYVEAQSHSAMANVQHSNFH